MAPPLADGAAGGLTGGGVELGAAGAGAGLGAAGAGAGLEAAGADAAGAGVGAGVALVVTVFAVPKFVVVAVVAACATGVVPVLVAPVRDDVLTTLSTCLELVALELADGASASAHAVRARNIMVLTRKVGRERSA